MHFVLICALLFASHHLLSQTDEALPAYTVGSLGAYWTIQRLVILLRGAR